MFSDSYIFKDLLEDPRGSRIIVPSVHQLDEYFIELLDQDGTLFHSVDTNDNGSNQLQNETDAQED